MSQYYYTNGKERFGPFTADQLKEKNITGNTLVWKEGLTDWVPAMQLDELNVLLPLNSTIPPPIAMPYGNTVVEAPPKNWLIESILVTVLCCLPFGIIGIIHSTKVDTLWSTGQHEAAYKASREAAKWIKLGAIIGGIVIILSMLLWVFGVLATLSTGMEV